MSDAQDIFTESTDEVLIARVVQGNEKAFEILVSRHMQMLYSVAYRMQFDTAAAEDIVQETLLRLWQKPHLWDKTKGASVKTWLYRIAYNLCIDVKRKPTVVAVDNVQEPVADELIADAHVEQMEISEKVKQMIAHLPDNQRAALVLTYYEGFSNKEVADIMGNTVKAVESLLVRARKNLQKQLDKDTCLQEALRNGAGKIRDTA